MFPFIVGVEIQKQIVRNIHLRGHPTCAAISHDGKLLALGTDGMRTSSIFLYCIQVWNENRTDNSYDVGMTYTDRLIRIFDLDSMEIQDFPLHSGKVFSVAFSSDSCRLLSTGRREIILWELLK
jgi:WD40 repeat protein